MSTLWVLVIWTYGGHFWYVPTMYGPFNTESACQQVATVLKKQAQGRTIDCIWYQDSRS
jgi:hypothetical protein